VLRGADVRRCSGGILLHIREEIRGDLRESIGVENASRLVA